MPRHEQPVTCSVCGIQLNEDSGAPVESRKLCPACGSAVRTVHIGAAIIAHVGFGTRAVVQANADVVEASVQAHDDGDDVRDGRPEHPDHLRPAGR
jgi:hypothetical protein